jgi:hypothetical protein
MLKILLFDVKTLDGTGVKEPYKFPKAGVIDMDAL